MTRALAVTLSGIAALAVLATAATAAVPRNTSNPWIGGTPVVGRTLKANPGGWANGPTSHRYQCYRCDATGLTNCVAVPGATGQYDRLGAADVGHLVTVNVAGCNRDGCAQQVNANGVGPVEAVPASTAAPTIAGAAVVGGTLTATPGGWAGVPTSFAYQWYRCDASGAGCGAIAGADASTYAVSGDDFGHTLVVRVTARNAAGAAGAGSAATAVVGKSVQGGVSISVDAVRLPDRLVVSGVQFAPPRLGSRAPFTARFRVTDTQGRVIDGALVYALGLAYAWLGNASEVATGPDGWATLTLRPTRAMPLRGALVLFVRARKPGDDPLAGVSTRRLVQVSIR